MKYRINFLFTILITTIIFYGCTESREDTRKPLNMSLTLETDYDKEPVIPDPATVENEVSAVIRYIPDFEFYGDYKERDECYQSNKADFSFLGLKNEMMILAYQIGSVTSQTSGCIQISYNISDNYKYDKDVPVIRERKVHGNCLILVVNDCVEEDNYVIVLDYENHKSYVQKTEIWNPMAEGIDHIPEIQLCDFTGDGLDEVVVYNALLEEETNVQIFRFNENGLKCIYYGLDKEEKDDSDIIAYLEDDYKAVIEYKPLGLKKKKSLLDLGYTKKQLRDKHDIGNRDLDIGVAQEMKIQRITDYEEVIRYSHFVAFAKYNSVCELVMSLKYSAKQDAFEIYKIDIKWKEDERGE